MVPFQGDIGDFLRGGKLVQEEITWVTTFPFGQCHLCDDAMKIESVRWEYVAVPNKKQKKLPGPRN